jgi:hypothetical protein
MDPIGPDLHIDARVAQLQDHRGHMVRDAVGDADIAPCGSSSNHEGPGLHAVRDHPVRGAAKRFHALYLDHAGASATYHAPHGVDVVGQVRHLGLLGGILDDRRAFGEAGHRQDVAGGAHARAIEEDVGALEALGIRLDIAMLDAHLGAERLHPFDVVIHGASADIAPAGKRNARASKTCEQRPGDAEGGSHALHQLVGSHVRLDPRSIDEHASIRE